MCYITAPVRLPTTQIIKQRKDTQISSLIDRELKVCWAGEGG